MIKQFIFTSIVRFCLTNLNPLQKINADLFTDTAHTHAFYSGGENKEKRLD